MACSLSPSLGWHLCLSTPSKFSTEQSSSHHTSCQWPVPFLLLWVGIFACPHLPSFPQPLHSIHRPLRACASLAVAHPDHEEGLEGSASSERVRKSSGQHRHPSYMRRRRQTTLCWARRTLAASSGNGKHVRSLLEHWGSAAMCSPWWCIHTSGWSAAMQQVAAQAALGPGNES